MTFVPARTVISGITQANPGVVTTSTNHGLLTGQVVRLNVPKPYGMVELNKLAVVVTKLSAQTFSIQTSEYPTPQNIDTSQFAAFTTPSNLGTSPEVVPIGSAPVLNATSVYFETQVADQTLNNSTVEIPN